MSTLPSPAAADQPRPEPRPSADLTPAGPASCGPDELTGPPREGGGGAGLPCRAFDPQQGVREWHVCAVGHKPAYHLARDCLHASLFRDRLVPWFHRYARKPPPWV